MKAIIETNEPVIRPVAAAGLPSRLVRSPVRTTGFQPVRAAAPLFHAWRA